MKYKFLLEKQNLIMVDNKITIMVKMVDIKLNPKIYMKYKRMMMDIKLHLKILIQKKLILNL